MAEMRSFSSRLATVLAGFAGRRGRRATGRAAGLPAAGRASWLPLTACPKGHRACLRCMEVDHCLVHRLTELGLTPGVELQVVQDGGPMLVSVRGSRVALGRELADNVWVELHPYGGEGGADR